MNKLRLAFGIKTAILLLAIPLVVAAAQKDAPNPRQQNNSTSAATTTKPPDYSGMYTLLKEGEFVQLTIEDKAHVTGFVSRYGDGESDKGAFLDQFFKSGTLNGNRLTFTTDTVHGVWFEFKGTVERGEGKNPGDEAYYVLKGTLVENSTDVNKKVTSQPRDVVFKLFPQQASSSAAERK